MTERNNADEALEETLSDGATLVKAAEDVVFGRSGCFVAADPDGQLPVAWNPCFPFAPDGTLELPD